MPAREAPHFTLSPRPWMTAPEARAVMAALAPGGEARFVGGPVRDALADRPLTGAVDIATVAEPGQVMALLAEANIRAVPTGIAHGTVTAFAGESAFEITTLRRDVATDGRHAEVAFTADWRADAARRDFTINAMSLRADGAGFDYFGGRDDLAAGRVRFVGDAGVRIDEDVLRILRFFRFHAAFGAGTADPDALGAIAAAAARVSALSGERVWAELSRILTGPRAAQTCALMARADVLGHLLPGRADVARLGALVPLEEGLGLAADAVRRLGALAAGGAEDADGVAERLRLSRAERERLRGICRMGDGIAPDVTTAEARAMIYRAGRDAFLDRLLLAWAGRTAAGADAALAGAMERLYREAMAFTPPRFPLGGADAARVGLAPGPAMGAALKAVEDWWVAEDFRPGAAALRARLAAEATARRS